MFQFTPARGGRPSRFRAWRFSATFQFTPARGGRPKPSQNQPRRQVSIHARAWRATAAMRRATQLITRFNSRPRVAGDSSRRNVCSVKSVSIHARAWRATYHSISLMPIVEFQFTPARGGRPTQTILIPKSRLVSIHARAWRATEVCAARREGSGFNSRPRVAGDFAADADWLKSQVSIHARAWRATAGVINTSFLTEVSIHARAWRATTAVFCFASSHMFQFTPARGGRLISPNFANTQI